MSPQSDSSPLATSQTNLQAEYTLEERKLLLEAAHEAILSALERRTIPLSTAVPHLSEPRGAFTTLYQEGKLRGCVGYPTPQLPLFQTVIETSRAAAFDDPRFMPVTLDEARGLAVAISVLSAVSPISAADIELGRHGLIISEGGRRGLLLPQVPMEHGWDRITFLEQTCWKAGLPLDAWKSGARIEAFTAEVFCDAEISV
jgi:AmmeMemoRadiSam system protein A